MNLQKGFRRNFKPGKTGHPRGNSKHSPNRPHQHEPRVSAIEYITLKEIKEGVLIEHLKKLIDFISSGFSGDESKICLTITATATQDNTTSKDSVAQDNTTYTTAQDILVPQANGSKNVNGKNDHRQGDSVVLELEKALAEHLEQKDKLTKNLRENINRMREKRAKNQTVSSTFQENPLKVEIKKEPETNNSEKTKDERELEKEQHPPIQIKLEIKQEISQDEDENSLQIEISDEEEVDVKGKSLTIKLEGDKRTVVEETYNIERGVSENVVNTNILNFPPACKKEIDKRKSENEYPTSSKKKKRKEELGR